MLHDAGEHPVEIGLERLAFERPRRDDDPLRPADVHPQPGEAEATLLLHGVAARPAGRGVDEHEFLPRVGPGLEVDDEHPVGQAHLVRRQADATRLVHDVEHLFDRIMDRVVDPHERPSASQERRVGELDEFEPAKIGGFDGRSHVESLTISGHGVLPPASRAG